jgi:hypothetical protein
MKCPPYNSNHAGEGSFHIHPAVTQKEMLMNKFNLCIVVSLLLAAVISDVLSVDISAFAQESKAASTVIKHKAIDYFVSGHRIRLEAEITDPAGVKLARCYFRAAGLADYVFVGMKHVNGDTYEAVLPKPSISTELFEYLFLAVNQNGEIVKTQVFRIRKNDDKEVPVWQQAVSEGKIKVSTELTQAPRTVSGFTDSITLDVVESAGRFGAAGGVYLLIDSGGGSSAADGLYSASAEGLSTTAVAGITAGVVAGGVAIGAAVGSGGGDGGDTTKPDVQSTPELNLDLNQITVRFTEKIDAASVSLASAISVVYVPDTSASVQWSHSGKWSEDDLTLYISFSRGSENLSGKIELTLYGGMFKDMNGNYMDERTFSLNADKEVTVTW